MKKYESIIKFAVIYLALDLSGYCSSFLIQATEISSISINWMIAFAVRTFLVVLAFVVFSKLWPKKAEEETK